MLRPSAKYLAKVRKYNKWRKSTAIPYLVDNFGFKCTRCQVSGYTTLRGLDVDHIVPVGRDSTRKMDLTNVQFLCRPCHSLKHDNPAEFNLNKE